MLIIRKKPGKTQKNSIDWKEMLVSTVTGVISGVISGLGYKKERYLSRSILSSMAFLIYPLTVSPAAVAADLISSYFSF